MLESQRVINQREQKANGYDKIIIRKQKDLEEIQKKIDVANRVLKDKQLNIVLQVKFEVKGRVFSVHLIVAHEFIFCNLGS